MSRDGSGNYSRVPGSAYTNNTTADGSEIDAEMNDIATALTQSISKDGQTVPTANLPMGGFKHTNCAVSASRTDYARSSQVQDGAFTYLTGVSGADTITATGAIGFSAYVAGQEFRFIAAGDNTGAVTLNINAVGAKAVTKDGATALAAGDIASGAACVVVYDGTQFQLVSARVVPAASDTVAGIVELATTAETQTGTDTGRAVTPAGLASVTATDTRAGLVELATTAEAKAGTDTARALTPAGMKAAQIIEDSSEALSGLSSVDWTGIPSWVKRITIVITGQSGSSTGVAAVRIGTGGAAETTGYSGSSTTIAVGTAIAANSTSWRLTGSSSDALAHSHVVTILLVAGNTWAYESNGSIDSGSGPVFGSGSKTLSGALDMVQLLMTSGAFDGGTATLYYE